jgi:hypothetical protein
LQNVVFLGFVSYASGIMDDKTIKRFLFGVLIGAWGFGLELGRAIVYYKRPRPDDDFVFIFMVGLMFLAMAVLNSIRLISQMRNLQDTAKK